MKLKKYLLGNLNESEAEEISLRLIADKTFENEMLNAEAELIEAFFEDSFTPAETKLFQTNFLINEDRENQMKEIYTLKKYAANNFQQEKTSEISKDSTDLWKKFRTLFSVYLKPIPIILTILIVCVLAGITWRAFISESTVGITNLEKEYAEINREDLNNLPELAISPIVLLPGISRSSDEIRKIESAKLGGKILFRLGLPFEIANKKFLKAELVKDREVVFTQNAARIYNNQSGQEVKLILPKSVFRKGQYQIKLENPKTGNSPIIYNFAVE